MAEGAPTEETVVQPIVEEQDPMERLARIEESVTSLANIVKSLIHTQQETKKSATLTPVEDAVTPASSSAPADYVEIVQEVFGPKYGAGFAVDVEERKDGNFKLIITPPELFRVTPDDKRVKVISTKMGGAGVREFAELVKAKIRKESQAIL